MNVCPDIRGQPFLSVECQKDEAEHVKSCHDCAQDSQSPDKIISVGISRGENRILRKESGKKRNAGDSDRSDEEGGVGEWDVFPQASHFFHVRFTRESMHDASGSQKQEALEKRVRVEVEHSSRISANTASDKHVSYLRDSRVSQDSLDVVLS